LRRAWVTLTDNHDGTWSYRPAANDDSAVSSATRERWHRAVAAERALDIAPVNTPRCCTDVATAAAYAAACDPPRPA